MQIAAATKQWILYHDESKLFVVAYIALAVILSITFGLFWLCVVVGVHYGFEVIVQYHRRPSLGRSLTAGLWEIKLDIFLIMMALLVSVYMEIILGAAGLSAGARTVATAGARFAGWQRVVRVFLLSVDDVAQLIRGLLPRKKAADHVDTGRRAIRRRLVSTVAPGDYASIAFGVLCALLLLGAPLLTDHSVTDVVAIVMADLSP